MALLPVTGFDLTVRAKDTFTQVLTLYTNVQTVTLTGATGGTFLLYWRNLPTTALAYNATAATVQTALQLLTLIGGGNVLVTGSAGGPYTVTWAGALADVPINAPQPILIADGTLLTGTTPTVVPAQGLLNMASGFTSLWTAAKTAEGVPPGPLFSYADVAAGSTGVTLGGAAGTVTLYILPAATALFTWSEADKPVYNLQLIDASGSPTVKTRWFSGPIHLTPTVL